MARSDSTDELRVRCQEHLAAFLTRLGVRTGAVRVELQAAATLQGWAEPGLIRIGVPRVELAHSTGVIDHILAHEAAHQAQFLATGTAGTNAQLEAEADSLAVEVLAGRSAQACLHASPRRLHWNRAGHYYTLYYMGLVAGAPENEAMKMAFYGQTPDLVSELDAPTQTVFQTQLKDSWGSTLASIADAVGFTTSDAGVRPTDWEVCTDVIEGLHCLTGASVENERHRRIAHLRSAGWGSLAFGIGLHALGDAWAHCSEGEMYGPHHGHMFGGHGTDSINQHVPAYIDYASTLYQILRTKIAAEPRTTIQVALQGLEWIARRWPDDEQEPNQIAAIRLLINELSVNKTLVAYEPPNSCIGWRAFLGTTYGGLFRPGDINEILTLARAWRVSLRDPRSAADRERVVRERVERQIRQASSGPPF